jgi:aspartate/methionine/tyrosine aminotransferase
MNSHRKRADERGALEAPLGTPGTSAVAERMSRLGTETAFAVSAEANDWRALGHAVYPFHLGDMDLRTPENVVEAAFRAIRDGKTGYCPNAGVPELREALAADVGAARGIDYGPHHVAVQPGGKPVIEKFLLTLMDPGDEVLYPSPGFPIYESQIEFLGGVAKPYGFVPGGKNFLLDFDAIEAAITPRTKLLIFNNLHNPTGAESPDEEVRALADLALRHDLYVLSDEAYWDVRYSGQSRSIASVPGMQERTVVLYTFSKKYAMTGWRLGGAIGPEDLIARIATLNVNQESCTTHFIQWAGVEALTGDQSGAEEILRVLRERRDLAVDLLREIPGVSCYRPEATFYLFPDVTGLMERKGLETYDQLRRAALEQTGVSFCTRLHFGRALPGEDRRYVRLAYSGISAELIREGLGRLKEWAQ